LRIMVLFKHNKIKHPFSKGWLMTFLLIGLFSIASIETCQFNQKQITKTEQVVSFNKTVKRTLSFKKIISSSLRRKNLSKLTHQQLVTVNRMQSKLIRVNERTALRTIKSFKRPLEYFRSAFIPCSSDEDITNS